MACVTKRFKNGKERWGVDFRDQQKDRHWKQAKPNTRAAADAMLAEIVAQIGRNEFIPPDQEKTFDELVAMFRIDHMVTLRPITVRWYESAWCSTRTDDPKPGRADQAEKAGR